MLEVTVSELDRTAATVSGDEETMEGKYKEFKMTNGSDTAEKEGSMDSKVRLIEETEDDIVAMKAYFTKEHAQATERPTTDRAEVRRQLEGLLRDTLILRSSMASCPTSDRDLG